MTTSSNDSKLLCRSESERRVVEAAAPNEHLLEEILSKDVMRQAWKRVKANKGAAGVDKMTIEEFPAYAKQHWDSVKESLNQGEYQPAPVRRV